MSDKNVFLTQEELIKKIQDADYKSVLIVTKDGTFNWKTMSNILDVTESVGKGVSIAFGEKDPENTVDKVFYLDTPPV